MLNITKTMAIPTQNRHAKLWYVLQQNAKTKQKKEKKRRKRIVCAYKHYTG